MALSPAEKQRAYRKRQNAKKLEALKARGTESAAICRAAFSEFAQNDPNYTDFNLALQLIGIDPPQFDDKRGPHEFAQEDAIGNDDPFPGAGGAIGRAEVTIGCLITAAVILAGIVNDYKRKEINERLVELEDPNTADRKTAMKQAVRLNKMLAKLKKPVRWAFSEWKVTGD